MAFHEIRFPVALSFGSSGGPERRTEVITLASGYEHRSTLWAHGRRRYDAGLGLRSLDDIHETLTFFEARRGRLFGFRWRDWADHKSCRPSAVPDAQDCVLGAGDGVRRAFQLVKGYASGGETYLRPIAKPVPETVRVAVAGVSLRPGQFAVDATTGLVTLAQAPGVGVVVTAGFMFDVPVRFDTDRIEVNLAAFEAGAIPSIPIVEVRV
jgi:uncharacterized protein (TIGR02217 family)